MREDAGAGEGGQSGAAVALGCNLVTPFPQHPSPPHLGSAAASWRRVTTQWCQRLCFWGTPEGSAYTPGVSAWEWGEIRPPGWELALLCFSLLPGTPGPVA